MQQILALCKKPIVCTGIVLAVLLAALFLVIRSESQAWVAKQHLPAGAIKLGEKNGVTLYTHRDPKAYKDGFETGINAYIVDGKKLLAVIKLLAGQQLALISAYENRVMLLSYPILLSDELYTLNEDRIFHTNKNQFYIVYRDSGIVQFADLHDDRDGGRLAGASSDGAATLSSSVASAEDGRFYPRIVASSLNGQHHLDRPLPFPMTDAEDAVNDVSFSPDGKHVAVVVYDGKISDAKTARAALYILDIAQPEVDISERATLSMSTDQMWSAISKLDYAGVATAFANSIIGWDSPTTVRVRTSPDHVETFSVDEPHSKGGP